MAKKYVYDTYPTMGEAEVVAQSIIDQGIPNAAVTLVGSKTHNYSGSANFITYTDLIDEKSDNRGFFAKLFGSDNESEFDEINIDEYRSSLEQNEILVLVDDEFKTHLKGKVDDFGQHYETSEAVNTFEDSAAIHNDKVDTNNSTHEIPPHHNVDARDELGPVDTDEQTDK